MIAIHPGEILREEYMAPLVLQPPRLRWSCGYRPRECMRLLMRSGVFLLIQPCGLQNFLKLILICGSTCRRSMKRIRWMPRSARIWNGLFLIARCRAKEHLRKLKKYQPRWHSESFAEKFERMLKSKIVSVCA